MPSDYIRKITIRPHISTYFVAAFCELKRLKSLRVLDLGNNSMEGTIHPCLGRIDKLEQLYLSDNRFNGTIDKGKS